jgi:hypothetical protein
VDGTGLTAVFYHAPPGVNWGIAKARQAVAVARRLSAQPGPVLLGADANTPLVGLMAMQIRSICMAAVGPQPLVFHIGPGAAPLTSCATPTAVRHLTG